MNFVGSHLNVTCKRAVDETFEFALDRLGYKKQKQEKVLRAFVSGNDVFAALPTGYGKSRAIAPPTSELRLLPLDLTAFCVPLDLVYSSRNIDTQLRFDKPTSTWPAAARPSS